MSEGKKTEPPGMSKRNHINLIEKVFGSPAASGTSHLLGRLADLQVPQTVLDPIVHLYSAAMGVDSEAYEKPEGGFGTFNGFFGRTLKQGEREMCPDPDALVSPCDGRISAFGNLDPSGTEFTIKKSRYTLESLLGGAEDAVQYQDGSYAVVYLHPRDYHRVHAPCAGRLTKVRHIPGARYPVTGWCEARVENIYDKNERMVFFFDLPSGAHLALVMVAAMGVGNIDTPFDPGVDRRQKTVRERRFDPAAACGVGDDIGAFLLGSTVVLVGSRDAISLMSDLEIGPTRLGLRIGTVRSIK